MRLSKTFYTNLPHTGYISEGGKLSNISLKTCYYYSINITFVRIIERNVYPKLPWQGEDDISMGFTM